MAGHSLARIAYDLGVTRGVVIGRVSRDGELQAFVAHVEIAVKNRHVDYRPVVSVLTAGAKPMVELGRGDCHFPLVEAAVVGGYMFCARPVEGEWTSYCAKHRQLCAPGGLRRGGDAA